MVYTFYTVKPLGLQQVARCFTSRVVIEIMAINFFRSPIRHWIYISNEMAG